MPAPTPSNEQARLSALLEYRLLDTAPETDFDDITALASQLCGVPIALMVLLDEGRQWFKSRRGVEVSETPRDHAFCAHAVLGRDPLVVEDASTDPRFVGNPLVTGEPHIRFYAGVPLVNPAGHALGTLCVIDRQPRKIEAGQLRALQILARQVVAQMELRRVAGALATTLENMQTLQRLLPVCAWCRKVRDDRGFWADVEDYLRTHAGTETSHGICPDCSERHFPPRR